MSKEVFDALIGPFIANGLIGSVCLALGYIALKLWARVEAERQSHFVALAAKDALIKELYDARIVDAKVGYEIVRNNERTMDALFAAINGRPAS